MAAMRARRSSRSRCRTPRRSVASTLSPSTSCPTLPPWSRKPGCITVSKNAPLLACVLLLRSARATATAAPPRSARVMSSARSLPSTGGAASCRVRSASCASIAAMEDVPFVLSRAASATRGATKAPERSQSTLRTRRPSAKQEAVRIEAMGVYIAGAAPM